MIYALEDRPKETRKCETHGGYDSVNYIGGVWSACPQCSKAETEARKAREAEQAAKEEMARWESKLKHSSIPERFRDRTLQNYIAENDGQARAKAFSLDYVENWHEIYNAGRNTIFCGSPGTGKNHLAIAIAIELMKQYQAKVLFTTVIKAIRRIKSTWESGSAETETQVLALYRDCDLLILDEVGVQFGSETEQNYISEIINDRYEARKPTIAISNHDKDGIKKYMGERALDRFREDGGKLIAFNWNSYRGKQ